MRLVNGQFQRPQYIVEAEFNRLLSPLETYAAHDYRQVVIDEPGEPEASLESDAPIPCPVTRTRRVPDLSQYFRVKVVTNLHQRFIDDVQDLEFVEAVYPAPTRAPMPADPQFWPMFQLHLLRLNSDYGTDVYGIDAEVAWARGILGDLVRVAIVDYHWNLAHADLTPGRALQRRAPAPEIRGCATSEYRDHGTAVLGTIAARHESDDLPEAGMRGIAPNATVWMYAADTEDGPEVNIAQAITAATSKLRAGDILLVEQQACIDPVYDASGLLQSGKLVPAERIDSVFAAIANAVAKGIIVIEPAGNGMVQNAEYQGGIDLDAEDWYTVPHDGMTGAIIVGAGEPGIWPDAAAQSRCSWSNYGSQVQVQGWGYAVGTLGYGHMRQDFLETLVEGERENHFYTGDFAGTSAAAAIVAGAAAALQSFYKAQNPGAVLTPEQMCNLLITTGRAQQPDESEHIGPLPNLASAIAQIEQGGNG
ncbi:MAG: S8 family serine peptidase [Anaerolineae bacterium]|nr:S8 family serine peptidase [Anaerolineae bacterium]